MEERGVLSQPAALANQHSPQTRKHATFKEGFEKVIAEACRMAILEVLLERSQGQSGLYFSMLDFCLALKVRFSSVYEAPLHNVPSLIA